MYSGNQCRVSPILGKRWAFFAELSSWYNDTHPLKTPDRERTRGHPGEGPGTRDGGTGERGRQRLGGEAASRRFLRDRGDAIRTQLRRLFGAPGVPTQYQPGLGMCIPREGFEFTFPLFPVASEPSWGNLPRR